MIEDLPGEVWASIEGFDGFYEVSSAGRVKSLKRTVDVTPEGRRPYTITIQERILRPGLSLGRPNVTLWRQHEATVAFVGQLVARAFLGEPAPGMEVMRVDGNVGNVALSNLRYATKLEVEAAKAERGTKVSGSRIKWAKLTEDDVRYIRANPDALSQQQLADRFGVGQPRISAIIHRKKWKDLP